MRYDLQGGKPPADEDEDDLADLADEDDEDDGNEQQPGTEKKPAD